jgi:hypothetical protein
LAVWKLDGGELISTTSVQGLYPNDTWSGPEVRWRRLRCDGGRLRVALSSDPSLFRRDQVVTAFSGVDEIADVRVPPAEQVTLNVPLQPRGGICEVRFKVGRTVVPKGNDPRRLGVHFNGFDYRAP